MVAFPKASFVMKVGSSFTAILLKPGSPGSEKACQVGSSATFMLKFTTRLIVSVLKAELSRRQDLFTLVGSDSPLTR